MPERMAGQGWRRGRSLEEGRQGRLQEQGVNAEAIQRKRNHQLEHPHLVPQRTARMALHPTATTTTRRLLGLKVTVVQSPADEIQHALLKRHWLQTPALQKRSGEELHF
jgi:hypothetical protein